MKTGLTIKEMAQELLRQSKAKQDYLVNTGSLSLSVNSDAPQLRVMENGLDMELMMYPFLTMNDHTEIVYSHLLDGGRVKIYVEKSDEHDGFHHAACFLPGCRWEDIVGFSDAEIQEYQKVIEASAEQIMRLATSSKG